MEHVLEYVNNQYGNYLVQHIIERANGMQHQSKAATPGSSINSGSGSKSSGGGKEKSTTPSRASSPAQSPIAQAMVEADASMRSQYQLINESLYRSLRGHFARLSRQKFSSNVVEKMLRIPDLAIRSAIVAELLEPESISAMLQCSYGNYVCQHVLYVATAEECARLFQRVRQEHVLAPLRKNIRMKWERLIASAHLIHPGLMVTPLGQGGADSYTVDENGIPQPVSTVQFTSQFVPHSYPSPAAIQIISSILGSTPSGGQDGGKDRGGVSPSNARPPTGVTPMHVAAARSPTFRVSGNGAMQIHVAGQANSPVMPPFNHAKSTDRRTHHPSIHSGSHSAANSPYMGHQPASTPHTIHTSSSSGALHSLSAATSPMHSPTGPYSAHSFHAAASPNAELGYQDRSHPASAAASPTYTATAHPLRISSPHLQGGQVHGSPSPYASPQSYGQPSYQSHVTTVQHPSPVSSPALQSSLTIQQQILNHQQQLQNLLSLQAQQLGAAAATHTAPNQTQQHHQHQHQHQHQSPYSQPQSPPLLHTSVQSSFKPQHTHHSIHHPSQSPHYQHH